MGYVADLSRYDPLEAVDLYPDGVILNIEDPGFTQKRDRAISNGFPWGTYTWVYPGLGAQATNRAVDAGVGPLGVWLDYEQEGVSPNDLQQALARADELGARVGVYTYLYILDSVAGLLGDHPLWLAYYPGGSDWQQGYSDTARARGAVLHQFTSSNGSRDLSVVVDPERWSAWTGGQEDIVQQQDIDNIVSALTTPDKVYGISPVEAAVAAALDKKVAPAKFIDGKPWTLLDWLKLILAADDKAQQAAVQAAVEAALKNVPASGVNSAQLAHDVVLELGKALAAPTS